MSFDKEKSGLAGAGEREVGHSDPLMDLPASGGDEDYSRELPTCDTDATFRFNAAVTEIIDIELAEDRQDAEAAKRLTASNFGLATEIPPVRDDITVVESSAPATGVFGESILEQTNGATGQPVFRGTQIGDAGARSFSEIFGPNAIVEPAQRRTDAFGPEQLSAQPVPSSVEEQAAESGVVGVEEVVTKAFGSDSGEEEIAEIFASQQKRRTQTRLDESAVTFANPARPTDSGQPISSAAAAAALSGVAVPAAKATDPEPEIPELKEPTLPVAPDRKAGGFTMMLRGEALPLPPKPMKPAPQAPPQAPLPASPSQYTQVITGGRMPWQGQQPGTPQAAAPAPYPAPAPYDYSAMPQYARVPYAVPQPSAKKSKVLTYLPLIIAGNVFVVMALLLILFFALKR